MKTFYTYLPFLISFFLGYFSILVFLNHKKRIPFSIHFFLSAGLGLGISAQITFVSFMLYQKMNKPFVLGLNLTLLGILIIYNAIRLKGKITAIINFEHFQWRSLLPYVILIIFSYPLWNHGHFYVYGGWDAWATWNLKSKMLFLSPDGWSTIFDPILWRSSPHYPLHLPMINNWGWIFFDSPDYIIPVTTAFIFSFSTVGLLLAILIHLTGSYYAIFCATLLLSSPMYVKLSLSQYADILVAYYLLAAIYCLLKIKLDHHRIYALLAGWSLGYLSFCKGEGLLATLILLCLAPFYLFWKNRPTKKLFAWFYGATLVASAITITFSLFVAPENLTFINGLTSDTHPVSLYRLKATFSFYLVELVSPTWHGLWIVLVGGLILSLGRCFSRTAIIFPVFLLGYVTVITYYYYVNTYFDSTRILWWLQVSLHRLMYATLPAVVCWTFYSVWQLSSKQTTKNPSIK